MRILAFAILFLIGLAAPAMAGDCDGIYGAAQVCGSVNGGAPGQIPERMQLAAPTTVYVNGTGAPATCAANSAVQSFTCAVGSDTTGNGTVAAPFQTLNQALLFVKSFDFNGFTPLIVFAYGSSTNYSGLCTGDTPGSQGAGGNAIFITGDSNSPTSVSILSPNSGEGVYVSDGCIIRLENLVVDNQASALNGVRVGQEGIVDILNVYCGTSWTSTSGNCFFIEKNGTSNLSASPGITALGCGASLIAMTGGTFNAAAVNPPFTKRTIAIPSAIACTAGTVNASGPAKLTNFNASTFTGSGVAGTTGTRAILAGPVFVDTGGSGINSTFPGNVNAILTGGAQTDTIDATSFGPLTINGTPVIDLNAIAATSLSLTAAGNGAKLIAADGVNTGYNTVLFGAPGIHGNIRFDGTQGSPSALVSGDEIARMSFGGGTSTTAALGNKARISCSAAENWSTTAFGIYCSIFTTAKGGGSPTTLENLRVQASGGLSVGNANIATDGGAGIAVATGFQAGAVAGVSCAANTVSLSTLVVTGGIVTHC